MLCVKELCVTERPGPTADVGRRTSDVSAQQKNKNPTQRCGEKHLMLSKMENKLSFRTELLVDVVCVTWRAKAVVMATHHLPVPLKNIEGRRTAQVRKPKDQRSSKVAKLQLAC